MARQRLPRVLMAGTRDASEVVRLALGGEVEFVQAFSVEEALVQSASGIDLVVCNLRFDNSRMFDFLGALRQGEQRHLPVVCLRSYQALLSPSKVIEMALGALGVKTYLDLPAIAQERGMDAAFAQLRAAVLAELPPAEGSEASSPAQGHPALPPKAGGGKEDGPQELQRPE
jgi:CheY-like chemotaxis protein